MCNDFSERSSGCGFDFRPSCVSDPVNSPDHYTQHGPFECIDIVETMSFNVGNATKYLWRHLDKGKPIQDLEKARWYIDREIGRLKLQEMRRDR